MLADNIYYTIAVLPAPPYRVTSPFVVAAVTTVVSGHIIAGARMG